MIVATARAMDMAFIAIGFNRSFQLFAGHGAIGDVRCREQEVDDLVFIKRRTDLRGGHRVLLDVLDEAFPILLRILHRGLLDQAVHFLSGDLDVVRLADFGQEQAQTDAADGDGEIFDAVLLPVQSETVFLEVDLMRLSLDK